MGTIRVFSIVFTLAAVAAGQQVGDEPPALVWSKLKGTCPASLDWGGLRSQVVVVSFGDDPVLKDDVAEWNEAERSFPEKPAVFLRVVGGSEFLLDQALERTAYEGCILFVTDSANQDNFKLPHFPRTVVVDKLGFIAGYSHGIPEQMTDLARTPPQPSHYPDAVADDVPSWEVHISPAPRTEMRQLGQVGLDHYTARNQPLKLIILDLWNMPMSRIGFPAGLDERWYDVTAHIPVADRDQLLTLVRETVQRYFGLRIEKETRMERIYELTVAGPSSQLQVAADGDQVMYGAGTRAIFGTARTMPEIAESLEGTGVLVVDKTGLKGKFDYTASTEASGLEGVLNMAHQLGLELTPTERSVELLVVRKTLP